MIIPQVIQYYSQNREDLYLLALLNKEEKGFYIDVGCYDETLHSVTKLFYNLGWSGINIDANPKFANKYITERERDIFLNVGISEKEGSILFRDYYQHDGLSTFSKYIQDEHSKENLPYKEYNVSVTTLKKVFEKQKVKDIAFLKVDVEGLELSVLKSNDWKNFRPKVVTYEVSDHLNCKNYLESNNYKQEFFDGLNYYFVDNNCPEITINDYAGVILSGGIMSLNEKILNDKYNSLKIDLNAILNKYKN